MEAAFKCDTLLTSLKCRISNRMKYVSTKLNDDPAASADSFLRTRVKDQNTKRQLTIDHELLNGVNCASIYMQFWQNKI